MAIIRGSLKIIIRESGFDEDAVVTYSYKTSSNIQSALALSDFIQEIAPDTKIIIHRDRDFMTDAEVEWTEQVIVSCGAIPFITEGSDIEHYFQVSEHLAELLGVEVEEIEVWKNEIAQAEHNNLVHKYLRKRDEVKGLYRNRDENPPDSMAMLGAEMPLPEEKRLGKYMLRKLRGNMHARFGTTVDVKSDSQYLWSEKLSQLREENDA